ncbi:DUF302 domain-containing protein [Nitrosophilus kaiyonis]|uniref:DUF302 domain-containing protein n=1 Tax=Nitrosophilus kaiyonis TaxID=2930200 RepID=UPI002493BAA7|nr:DUF302 domain-containing protein [Nitrosophilus kaiyonis]
MKKITFLLAIILSLIFANEEIIIYKSKVNITPQKIEEIFIKEGYSVQTNRDMNGPYKKQFGKSEFDIYNLMTVYYPKITKELVLKDADSGIFAPFSIVIWKKKENKYIHMGVLSAKAKAKILGFDFDDKLLAELEKKNIETIKKALPNAKRVNLSYKPKPIKEKLKTKYVFEVADDEAMDTKDELEMMIEDGLKPIGFVMANFNDYNYDLKEAGIKDFIFYDTYSLCKLKVIYTVSKIRPEAGVFAPCTMAIYQKRGTNKMVIVFPNIYNWISTLNINDENAIKELKKAQKDMINVIENSLP